VRRWDDLIGAERPRSVCERALERGDVAHGYLFAGPDGVGKREGALLLASALLCESGSARSCGACAACRDVGALRHEDLLLLHGAGTPFWHDPARLAETAGLAANARDELFALLDRLASSGVMGRPVPGPGERRRVWPLFLSPDGSLPREGGRAPREEETVSGRLARLREGGKLTPGESRLARLVALPPVSVSLYRSGARGLGIASFAPREGRSERSVREFLERKPARGRWKIAIVDDAHWMTEEAQNSLLKTLEEPPAGAVLVLVTASPGALLPTILSRVRRVSWRGLRPEEMADFLERTTDHPADDRALLAGVGGGSAGRALREAPASLRELRDAAMAVFRASAEGNLRAFLGAAPRLVGGRGGREEDRERLLKALDILLLYARDLVARGLIGAGAPLANADLASGIDGDLARIGIAGARHLSSALVEARERLLGFSDPRLVLETLGFSLFPKGGAPVAAPAGRK
jgi:DNA polymerase-3 subunit delta'